MRKLILTTIIAIIVSIQVYGQKQCDIRNHYFDELKKDSLFNSVMTELVSKTIDKKVAKDTVSMDKLLNVDV